MTNVHTLSAICWLASIAPVAALADETEVGEALFERCARCHVADAEQNRAGPHLVNILNRPVASVDSFQRYSDEIIAIGETGMAWTPEALGRFLSAPGDGLAGLRHPSRLSLSEIAELLVYLSVKAESG